MRFSVEKIGVVESSIALRQDHSWGEQTSVINVSADYSGGLAGLEDFSHAIIVYYLDQAHFEKSEHLQRKPQNREDMPLVGIFSQRAKDRPNQLGITAVEIVAVLEDNLVVKGLDAIDGTPVLDIKPYYPMYDRKEAVVPEWVNILMAGYF